MKIIALTFNGENFDDINEFVGADVHMTYNAMEELNLLDSDRQPLLTGIKAGDKIVKKDGTFTKIEK